MSETPAIDTATQAILDAGLLGCGCCVQAENEQTRKGRLCRCGHPKSDHTGRLTSWAGRLLSIDACVAQTKVARAGNYAERVGGDRCDHFDPPTLRERIAARLIPAGKDGS